jgi:hypothetical protein
MGLTNHPRFHHAGHEGGLHFRHGVIDGSAVALVEDFHPEDLHGAAGAVLGGARQGHVEGQDRVGVPGVGRFFPATQGGIDALEGRVDWSMVALAGTPVSRMGLAALTAPSWINWLSEVRYSGRRSSTLATKVPSDWRIRSRRAWRSKLIPMSEPAMPQGFGSGAAPVRMRAGGKTSLPERA